MDTDQRSAGHKKNINWKSQETDVLLNPAWPADVRRDLYSLAEKFPQNSHLWIASSGTSAKDLRSVKLIAVSKKAFLVAAAAANEHLASTKNDIWFNALPGFHVGGISIYARAFLSGAKVISYSGNWDTNEFYQMVSEEKVSLASLVPTQIFDLVERKLKSPPSLRAIVVGGGALGKDLYLKALELGWPLLPSYGMTECCSQVATAEISGLSSKDARMKILSHVQAIETSEGKLKIKSEALLTGYARWNLDQAQWIDPKEDGWLTTDDQVELSKGYLVPKGRGQQYIKILGEGISLFRVQEIFENIVREEDPENWKAYALVSTPHPRKENEIVLLHATSSPDKIAKILATYNSQVLSIEKSDRILAVDEVPRTDLGKIKYEALLQKLKN